MKTRRSILFPLFLLLICGCLSVVEAGAQSPISATDKYCWSENGGWLNFRATHGRATVYSSYLAGWIWCESIGWIKLGAEGGGPYDNTSAVNWGVNMNQDRVLSGYAWSEVAGWVNFSPKDSQVVIGADGWFSGFAWNEGVGWIKFRNSVEPEYGVQVLFNDAPVASDQSVTVNQDTPVDIILSASDPEGDALTFEVVQEPGQGTLSGNAPNLTYTPANGYFGADFFTFKANDGQFDSNIATVDLTVVEQVDRPTANDQRVICNPNTPIDITLTGSDPGSRALTYEVVIDPAHGLLTGNPPALTYTPSQDYSGGDLFTFKVNNGFHDSDPASVSISVGSRQLTVSNTSPAGGAIKSDPQGIDCGETCQEDFTLNTLVRLEAEASTGYAFDGWSLSECPGTGRCSITIDQDYTVAVSFSADNDGDGVSDAMENGGPNNGDANKDGIKDAQQSHVATLKNINGDYVTLETGSALSLIQVKATTAPSTTDMPAGYTFPLGFFSFTILNVTSADQLVAMTMTIYSKDMSIGYVHKYGPTADHEQPYYYLFSYDGTTGALINQLEDKTVVGFVFMDGSRGDDDLTVNSRISDDCAPAAVKDSGGGGGGGGGSSGGGCFLGSL